MPDGITQFDVPIVGPLTGSTPGWLDGYVPPAAEWNAWWAQKLDVNQMITAGYPFLSLAGGQMTGPILLLDGPPVSAAAAANKAYVDSAISTANGAYLPLAGGTVTGQLTVNGVTTLKSDLSVYAGGASTIAFGSPTAQARMRMGGNASIGITGTDGGNLWACGNSWEAFNGVGFQTSCAAQKIPQGLYGVVANARDGSFTAAGAIISRASGVNQVHQLGLFRFSRTNTQEITLAALGNQGAASITDAGGAPGAGASGGAGWNVNDRAYDNYQNTYTVLTTDGAGAITVLRMDTIAYITGAITNPVAITASPGYPGTGASVNLSSNITNKFIITVAGELNLNGTVSNTVRADPTIPLGIATKQYADKMVPLAGGTMTGLLTLSGNPTAANHAVNKTYSDLKLALTGGTLSGALTVGSGAQNALTVTPGAAASNTISLSPSGTGVINITGTTNFTGPAGISVANGSIVAGISGPNNAVTLTPGASAGATANIAVSGARPLQLAASGGVSTSAALTVTTNLRVNGTSGFNNTAPVAKPTVTGAKGSNAALASLMTALAAYGLVTDSTTA